MKTKEYVRDGLRFQWAGGSFITVRPIGALMSSVPADMYEIPDWVNMSKIDDEAFRAICRLYTISNSEE